jgi:phage gp36-like protein
MGFTVNTEETDHGAPPVYGSLQAMVDRFGQVEMAQISDHTGQGDGVDEAAVQRALEDAGAEIDGYLAGRYTLPLASVPRVLVNVGCDIARYRLYKDIATDLVRKRYEDAVKLLEKVASGKVTLGLDVAKQPVAEAGGPAACSPGRVFSASTLADY